MKSSTPRNPTPSNASASSRSSASEDPRQFASQHLRWGWWSLLVFLTLGLVLESLHGFKVGFYLNLNNETRRLTWTLAHAHGTLLGVLLIAFGLTVGSWSTWDPAERTLAGRSLRGATLLIPGGFFLGGIFARGGDPGIGILLVPIGALLLFTAVLLTALQANRAE